MTEGHHLQNTSTNKNMTCLLLSSHVHEALCLIQLKSAINSTYEKN